MANRNFTKGGRLAPKPITSNLPPRTGAPRALPNQINMSDPALTGGVTPRRPRNFSAVYNRPDILRKAVGSGALTGQAPINSLKQARTNRRQMVQNLIQKAGGEQAFQRQAYGSNYNPGDLRAALRTVRQANTQVQSGAQPPSLMQTQLYHNALATRNKLLAQRRQALQRLSRGPGQIAKAAQQF